MAKGGEQANQSNLDHRHIGIKFTTIRSRMTWMLATGFLDDRALLCLHGRVGSNLLAVRSIDRVASAAFTKNHQTHECPNKFELKTVVACKESIRRLYKYHNDK